MHQPMHWVYLGVSGLLEIGWVLSLRATEGFTRPIPIVFYAIFGASSAFCLSMAMKSLPMVVAYSVWVGITAIGSLLIDVLYFQKPYNPANFFFIALIGVGVAGIKVFGAPSH